MMRPGGVLILVFFLFGCATSRPAQEAMEPDSKTLAMQALSRDMRQGMEALSDKDDIKAANAFISAFRQFRALDEEGRAILESASANLRNVVEISGFEYAKKESYALLLLFLEMERTYMDSDPNALKALSIRFNAAYQDVQQKTAEEKRKRIEELDTEISQKRDEAQPRTAEALLADAYPAAYTVKKGDTLPSIAARHDIYNDSFMWPLIYKANRDQIKDPKVLYIGQNLKVPRDITIENIVEARREAGAPEPDKIPKDAYTPKGRKK